MFVGVTSLGFSSVREGSVRFWCIPCRLSVSRSRDGVDRWTRFTTGVVGVGPAIAWLDPKGKSRADPILGGSPQGIPFLRPRPSPRGRGGRGRIPAIGSRGTHASNPSRKTRVGCALRGLVVCDPQLYPLRKCIVCQRRLDRSFGCQSNQRGRAQSSAERAWGANPRGTAV